MRAPAIENAFDISEITVACGRRAADFRKLGTLLKSIVTENVVGLRVRAILGILAYTSCSRAGAISMLQCADFHEAGDL
jgi:hypothetical protein